MTAALQQITLLLSFVVIVFYGYRIYHNKQALLISIPVIALMVHFCVFFLFKDCIPDKTTVNMWSSAIRLQTTLTFLAFAIYNIYRDRGRPWIQG